LTHLFVVFSGLRHNAMGGDEGRKQRLTSLKAIDQIFERSLNSPGNPPTRCGGYGFGEGWINPTRTRTPGQPMALTRGFIKPVTIPTHRWDRPSRNAQSPMQISQGRGSLCCHATIMVWWCFWQPLKIVQQAHQHVHGKFKYSWTTASARIFCLICIHIPTCNCARTVLSSTWTNKVYYHLSSIIIINADSFTSQQNTCWTHPLF